MSRTAVIFPGQGAQKVGMGRDVADASPAAAEVFRQADEILGLGLSRICFEGPETELARTDIQQPAIFVTSMAIWRALIERGASADALLGAAAGLSLGEYTALCVAGSLSFESALKLVRRRGELMQDAAGNVAGSMVSIIGGEDDAAVALCAAAAQGDVLLPANFNCPGQVVISGATAACERAVAMAGEQGVRAVALKVVGAFHSPLMQPAAEGLAEALSAAEISSPGCPVIANVDATPHKDPAGIRDALSRQLTSAVQWRQSIERLIEEGFDTFVEVGPGRVLTGLMRKINRKVKSINVSSAGDLDLEAIATAKA